MRYNTELFIERCKKIHGEEFDYSQVLFVNMKEKVNIICKKCNASFWQTAFNHIRGNKCFTCANNRKRLNLEGFVEKASKIHFDKYDYSNVEYLKNCIKVTIVCKEHNFKFQQTPNSHLNGSGCPKCANNYPYDIVDFIEKAKQVHGSNYTYSLVKFKNAKDKIKIYCTSHGGYFDQVVSEHLSGHKCHKCYGNGLYSNEDIINIFRKTHGDKYDYSLVNYIGMFNRIIIKCPKHGIFEQIAKNHYDGAGCPQCYESRGENIISVCLKNLNIDFKRQFYFDNCKGVYKNSRRLPFDFYLPDYNLCIEYDGEQHYRPVQFRGISLEKAQLNFERVKTNDKIKTNYCLSNNIKLLRIPYTEFKRIEEILNVYLNLTQ